MYKILVIMAGLLASQQVFASNWYVGAGLGVGHARMPPIMPHQVIQQWLNME